jgi:hypothetical protein
MEVKEQSDPVAELAHRLDCFTQRELRQLAGITESTEEAWRRRGIGPEHILIGNTVLYPRDALAEFLKTKIRTPRGRIAAKEVL